MNKRLKKKLDNRVIVGFAQVSSVYGGPEEGGWDYEAGHPVHPPTERIFTNWEAARRYRDKLRKQIQHTDLFRGVGVGGCGDNADSCVGSVSSEGLEVEVQSASGRQRHMRSWPDRRPHYE